MCDACSAFHVPRSTFKSRGQDLNLRPPGYEPGELPDCSTPRRGADCSTAVTILPVNWPIYAALAVGFLAVAGGLVFLTVRALDAWRAFKRLRRHLGRELER